MSRRLSDHNQFAFPFVEKSFSNAVSLTVTHLCDYPRVCFVPVDAIGSSVLCSLEKPGRSCVSGHGCCLRRIVDFEAFFATRPSSFARHSVTMHSQGVAYLNACCVFATLQRRFYVKTDVEKSVLKTISTPGLLPTIPSYRCPPRKEGENTGSRYGCCGYVRAEVRASLKAQKSVQSHPPGHARGLFTTIYGREWRFVVAWIERGRKRDTRK